MTGAGLGIAMAQRFGQQNGVLVGAGLGVQFLRPPGTYEMTVLEFGISGGNDLAVGQLIAHIAMIHAAGKEKAYRLTGEIFKDEVLHQTFLYGLKHRLQSVLLMDVSAGRNTGFRHAVFTLLPLPDAASELRLLRLPRPWAQLRFAERESRDESRSAGESRAREWPSCEAGDRRPPRKAGFSATIPRNAGFCQ